MTLPFRLRFRGLARSPLLTTFARGGSALGGPDQLNFALLVVCSYKLIAVTFGSEEAIKCLTSFLFNLKLQNIIASFIR